MWNSRYISLSAGVGMDSQSDGRVLLYTSTGSVGSLVLPPPPPPPPPPPVMEAISPGSSLTPAPLGTVTPFAATLERASLTLPEMRVISLWMLIAAPP